MREARATDVYYDPEWDRRAHAALGTIVVNATVRMITFWTSRACEHDSQNLRTQRLHSSSSWGSYLGSYKEIPNKEPLWSL